jgi:hypothetical protein
VFYRGGWCPYCNITLRTYQAQLVPALAERGIGLVAIGPEAPGESLSTKKSKELTFTVLSDPGNQIAAQLGIRTAPSDGARAAQLQLGLDLTRSTRTGPPHCPCLLWSSPTPTASSDGSMCTPTTPPWPNPATSCRR